MIKKILSLSLALVLLFSFAACKPEETPTAPDAPQNIKISDDALITWDAVDGALGYIVKINENDFSVTTTSYQASASESFTYSVTTVGKGYVLSEQSQTYTYVAKEIPTPPKPQVTVTIVGGTDIKGGKTLQLEANVEGSADKSVVWSVTKGADVISVSENGLVTAKEVETATTVEVEARSNANPEKFATKTLVVGVKPVLTQAMLDALTCSKIAFNGYVNISAYTIGSFSKLEQTYSMVIKTVMGGDRWYAEYENSLGVTNSLYCAKYNDMAALVGLSLNNTELYEVMTDDNGREISWEESGYYNNFVGLTVDDFTFNEETWNFDYNKNDGLAEKMIASANPYDFKVDGFSLLIADGEVSGIYAKSADDYSVLAGYRCVQELMAVVFADEEMEIPSIGKFSHEDIHDKLNQAVANMQALDSYNMTMTVTMSTYGTVTQNFFKETITNDTCLFVPYTVTGTVDKEENRTYVTDGSYGYRKIDDGLYNTFYTDENGFVASRAYNSSNFKGVRPTFDFAGEIFRSYFNDSETGETTYYVADEMSVVAKTFYNGVGNDSALYGMFATPYRASDLTIIPSVTVNAEGYITEAVFYFNMTIMYGVVEITYSDFNTATLPEFASFDEFSVRQVPTQWSGMIIDATDEETNVDFKTDAAEYIDSFDICPSSDIPFFGTALGDAFGFVMQAVHISTSTNKAHMSLLMYYDVPLDDDYTIDSSLKKIGKFLTDNGFVRNKQGEYNKGNVWIEPTDNDLDLIIYIWTTN